MSRVFRSLTKGSVDRTFLQKPTLSEYVRVLGSQLTQGYSDTGEHIIGDTPNKIVYLSN